MNWSFYIIIKAHSGMYPSSTILELLAWDRMTFEIRTKWAWYFRYRAALLQVKYPKQLVEIIEGRIPIDERSPIELQEYKQKSQMTVLKRKVTRWSNAITVYEKSQAMLLIPDYDHPEYIKAKEKLDRTIKELKQLED